MIKIFTDGACSRNPGPGGWAFIIKDEDEELAIGSGGDPDTTNNRMELQAVIAGIGSAVSLKTQGVIQIEENTIGLTTDSAYVVNGITKWIHNWKKNGWKTSGKKDVLNKDLWETLDKMLEECNVEWNHVRGHSGHPENEKCDKLAVAAYQKYLK